MNDSSRFDPASVGIFRVADRTFDAESRTVTLHYAFDDHLAFVETDHLRDAVPEAAVLEGPGLDRALLHLHIAAGTSYYKAAAPPVVVVDGEAA